MRTIRTRLNREFVKNSRQLVDNRLKTIAIVHSGAVFSAEDVIWHQNSVVMGGLKRLSGVDSA